MFDKNLDELLDLLESGEITEEAIAEECDVSVIGKILELHIGRCSENNDVYRLTSIAHLLLYKTLPQEQQKALHHTASEAEYQISQKIARGELTPMMLEGENKFFSYTKYYYYLTRELCNTNLQKAKESAVEVYSDILQNDDIISGKAGLLERYKEIICRMG